MPVPVLQILSGIPRDDGSGVMADSLARINADGRWQHHLLHPGANGASASDTLLGGLPADRVHHVQHAEDAEFSPLEQPHPHLAETHRSTWEAAIANALKEVQPAVIHSHHLWTTTAVARQQSKRLGLQAPVIAHCYGDELRLFEQLPEAAEEVKQACQQCDKIIVHDQHTAGRVVQITGADSRRIHVVSAGLEDCFHQPPHPPAAPAVLYCGELQQAGGLAWLLDAIEQIAKTVNPDVRLHVTGAGQGRQRDSLLQHIKELSPLVEYHGVLNSQQRAGLMRRCHAIVSPVFTGGVSQSLLEAAACGCHIVCTGLPGETLAASPQLPPALTIVPPPTLGEDQLPVILELPVFRRQLGEGLAKCLASAPLAGSTAIVAALCGQAAEISKVWSGSVDSGGVESGGN